MRADMKRDRMKSRAINHLRGLSSSMTAVYGWPCVSRHG
jgi:hypothetical protein